ncbi:MAG: hypothetical protein ACK5NG_02225 [Chthoniobacterales bacterium]
MAQSKKNKKSEKRLNTSVAIERNSRPRQNRETKFDSYSRRSPGTIPTRWVKLIVGAFLLPVAWILTQTFFGTLAWVTVTSSFWATPVFWFFALGCILWTVIFFGLPRPMWIYVLGHELTHVIWVWLMGGRVSAFRVSKDGGYILANKVNTWIALAPYFFPLYSLIVMAVYTIAAQFIDVSPYQNWLFGALGFTWAFHFTFTLLMIPRRQPDLEYGGHFFSLIVIYIANLLILSLMLIVASEHVSFFNFGSELFHNAADFSTILLKLTRTPL